MGSAAAVHVDQDVNVEVVVGMCAEGSEVVDMSGVQMNVVAAQVRMRQLLVASGDQVWTCLHPQPCPRAVVYPRLPSALFGWSCCCPSEVDPELNAR